MTDSADGDRSLAEAEEEFMRAHHDILADPRYDVEALDRAGCGPRVTNLARLAIGADSEGRTPDEWRAWVLDGIGPEAEPFLDEAEQCMRVSGLWPWPS